MFDGMPFTNNFSVKSYNVSIYGKMMFNTTTGHLYIYDDCIEVESSAVSSVLTGNVSRDGYRRRYYRLDDITCYHDGFLATFSSKTASGDKIGLSSWKKKEIVNEVETRRKMLVATAGLDVPPMGRE